jgi:hypothetical protein
MRSRNTFAEEYEVLGKIPGLLFEDEPPIPDPTGRFPSGLLDSIYSERVSDAGLQSPDYVLREEFLDTGCFVQGFDVNVASHVGVTGGIENWVLETLGIDIVAACAAAEGSSSGRGRLAEATARFGSEAFGCYLPWHTFGRSRRTPWGMYFFLEPLIDWAAQLRRQATARLRLPLSPSDASFFTSTSNGLLLARRPFGGAPFTVPMRHKSSAQLSARPIVSKKPWPRQLSSRARWSPTTLRFPNEPTASSLKPSLLRSGLGIGILLVSRLVAQIRRTSSWLPRSCLPVCPRGFIQQKSTHQSANTRWHRMSCLDI